MATILVVDDEPLIRLELAEALEDIGFDVLHADDGFDALKVARRLKPALVVTDFKMPVMNGIELAQAIHHHYKKSVPPIILRSAHEAAPKFAHCGLFAAVYDKSVPVAGLVNQVVDEVCRASRRIG
ncbi:response regulator [Acetobacter nitrogenifigens DSM 23921 = NBRC 105050]|uniref:Response regulatory domain-containing protein n=1 Tax=Acetobacter nitrogenifigens DSM 23921 = NBRC 105050 TaxID=1120919 RepID=A0A511XA09_9PROT|nr:response regulator [Acetobacter nitrogenifigens]GBQ97790.1 response regulator [Acetobacter nitrogenifigens DSM 23921 = NBRC 105050]GEN59797.1 hypothetical protein ANI02nite_16810 [Acetobacter nitrogenifigens DSM 23921 = NBRC 105050]